MPHNARYVVPLVIAIAGSTLAQSGRVIVVSDEFPLANARAHNPPNDAGVFAVNVATWFTGGAPGNFLVASSNAGFLSPLLRQSMEGAGQTWTINATPNTALENLLNYDAIFLAGTHSIPPATVIDYVDAGGCIYIAAGTGTLGGAVGEANFHNQYLLEFGLQLGSPYNNAQLDVPISGTSPLLAGVDHLYSWGSSPLTDATPDDDSSMIIFEHPALRIGIYSVACPLVGDVNCDCATDLDDLLVVLGNFGATSGAGRSDGDLDGDEDVDLDDLLVLLGEFGAVC